MNRGDRGVRFETGAWSRLPGARKFDDHLGFEFVGVDPSNRGLPFYELSPAIARRILTDHCGAAARGVARQGSLISSHPGRGLTRVCFSEAET